eukprot:1161135-Pelagomonas_calceolata.AAC.5
MQRFKHAGSPLQRSMQKLEAPGQCWSRHTLQAGCLKVMQDVRCVPGRLKRRRPSCGCCS